MSNPIQKTSMKNLIYIFSIVSVSLFSCKKDPCKDIDCGSNGSCNDGNCICESGYTGTNCELEERAAFIGDFSVTDACNVGTFDYQINISGNAEDVIGVSISNFGDLNLTVVATISGSAITISEQTVNGYIVSGSGNLVNDELSISYTISNTSGQSLNCQLSGETLE